MRYLHFFAITSAVAYAGCAAHIPATSLPTTVAAARADSASSPNPVHLTKDMLIFITDSGQLRYWPIDKHGGRTSHPIGTVTGASAPTAMAADGNTIAIAFAKPPSIVLYNTTTAVQTSLPNSNGSPIDIAFDKQGDLIALTTYSDVVAYKPPAFKAKTLHCGLIGSDRTNIAADREGDIFINQTFGSTSAVIEIPKGPNGYEPGKCSQLPISEEGYSAGLLVDPNTDALVVFHEPDECAGGNEAEMDIYGKPYGKGTTITKNLNGNCAYMLRFGPDSQQVYFSDGSPTLRGRNMLPNDYGVHIEQRDYPDGGGNATYRSPHMAAGVATIPNELPN